MHAHLSAVTTLLQRTQPLGPEEQDDVRRACAAIAQATPDDVTELLVAMRRRVAAPDPVPQEVFDHVLSQLVLWQRQTADLSNAQRHEHISLLYNTLGESSPCRWRLLQWLTIAAQDADLRLFVELVVAAPPPDAQAAALVVAPLFQRTHYDAVSAVPRLARCVAVPLPGRPGLGSLELSAALPPRPGTPGTHAHHRTHRAVGQPRAATGNLGGIARGQRRIVGSHSATGRRVGGAGRGHV